MRKHKMKTLTPEDFEKIVSIAQEEKFPFELIKLDYGLGQTEVIELMKKTLPKDAFETWKKVKTTLAKPKPKATKPIIDDDIDDLGGKYYFKNKFD